MRHFSLIVYTCAAVLPVLASSCSIAEQSPVSSAGPYNSVTSADIQRAGGVSINKGKAAVLVYNEKSRLESYSNADLSSGKVTLASTGGRKTAVVVANIADTALRYEQIASLEALGKFKMDFTGENPEAPVARGTLAYDTSGADELCITLTPLLARVEIRIFSTDFSGKPYEGQKLEDAKAYLINLNAFCPLSGTPSEVNGIVNEGCFDFITATAMEHTEMILSRRISGTVLYCYPRPSYNGQAGLGSCITRLVIEGKLDGHTYYYPITVGEDGLIESGKNYVYDILIKSKGTSDPDKEATPQMLDVKVYTKQWIDNGSTTEHF